MADDDDPFIVLTETKFVRRCSKKRRVSADGPTEASKYAWRLPI